jgi:hypothetical protein
MPAVAVPKNALARDPGYLYVANLGTSLPANTVAGSVFTDAWPSGWNLFGITRDGSEFDYTLTTGTIDAAEYYDPLVVVTTGRATSLKAELIQVHATNMKRAINGGNLTVTGSGATQLNTLTPPAVGAEIRQMIGWESQDSTERLVMEQVFQTGTLTILRRKGVDNAGLTVDYTAEIPASGFPFQYFTAGTLRG